MVFYGREHKLQDLRYRTQEVYLPPLLLDELLTEKVVPVAPPKERRSVNSRAAASHNHSADEAEIIAALQAIPKRHPGTGNYNECLTVLMALNTHFGPDRAIELAEAWSPSQEGWDVAGKIRGFTTQAVTIASLFYLAGQHGYIPQPKVTQAPRIHLPTEEIEVRHLPSITSTQKLVILRSYQGTGKTTAIEQLVKKHTEARGKVLVIAHRRTLLKQISARFGIDNYESVTDLAMCKRSLAITYDSLYKLTPSHYRDALVILDEFTQGLHHLAGATCKENRSLILSTFGWVLKNAQQVIASDADAGDPDITYVMSLMGVNSYYFLENTWRPQGRVIQLFKNKLTLQAELFEAVRTGRKVVVACDSRMLTEAFERALLQERADLTVLKVNSKNSQTALVQNFITNIPTKVQNYQVLVYSPTLFTGVDINVKHFEEVYLFADGGSQNHQDLMQAINRVRDEAALVKAWITPKTEARETDPQVLYQRYFKTKDDYRNLMTLNDVTGTWAYDPKWDTYLTLVSQQESSNNASHSELKSHFVAMAQHLGFTLTRNNSQDVNAEQTKQALTTAKAEVEAERVTGVTAAEDISRPEAEAMQKEKGSLTPQQEHKLERFYYTQLNGNSTNDLNDLIKTPLKQLSAQVRAFEALAVSTDKLIHRDQMFVTEIIPDKEILALQTDLRRRIEAAYGGYGQECALEAHHLAEFAEFMKAEARQVEKDLGFAVPENVEHQPIKTLNKYLKQLGLVASVPDILPSSRAWRVKWRAQQPDQCG